MVFQRYALYPSMTVADIIGFALRMQKRPKAERQAKVREVAELLQIEHLLDRKPGALSGGQRQRVAMGRALVVGDTCLPLPATAGAVAQGRKVQIGLRPEWFTPAMAEGNLTLAVDVLEPTGPDIYAALRFGQTPLMARLPAGTALMPGSLQAFDIDLGKAVLFDAETDLAIYG